MEEGRLPPEAIRNEVAARLSRRDVLGRASALGLGAVILGALPVVERLGRPEPALARDPDLLDATLQAFFDTIIPGKGVPGLRTELGHPIHPKAIAGVDREHGAVYTDALLLAHNPRLGFDTLAPPLTAELETRSLARGGLFLELDYEGREAVCIAGFEYDNPTRVLWEAAGAVAFVAFVTAGNVRNATKRTSAGYRIMGFPGTAPHGHPDFSYGGKLSRERTQRGSLP